MTDKLTSFLTRHNACIEGVSRLAATGAATPEEAFERANARDLVWAVTRPGVMSKMQRRKFLSEAVLAPIEHLLTDERSKNILRRLRADEPITEADASAACTAAASQAAAAAAYAACAESCAESWAARAASLAEEAYLAVDAAAASLAYAAYAAASLAEEEAASCAALAASRSAALAAEDADARDAQAKWLRDNFVLNELNIN